MKQLRTYLSVPNNESTYQAIDNQSANQHVANKPNQSTNQTTNKQTNKLTNKLTNLPIIHHTNQPSNPKLTQPSNQQTDQQSIQPNQVFN
jgi:hypothetical protein